jgi:hypothetical protein
VAAWFSWGDVGRLPIKHLCGDNSCCNPLHLRVQGVPHYYHNRRLQSIDLEFSTHKLNHETTLFLKTTQERDPKRFLKLEAANQLWIEFRMRQDGPVTAEEIAALMTDDADDEPEFDDED